MEERRRETRYGGKEEGKKGWKQGGGKWGCRKGGGKVWMRTVDKAEGKFGFRQDGGKLGM